MKIKRRKIRTAIFLTLVSVFMAGVTAVPVRAVEEEEKLPTGPDWAVDMETAPEITAESAILMDADTGVTLYEKNIHAKQYPASITKLLTCLVAAENSELTDVVTFSHEAVFGIERGSSNIGIDEGEQLTMEECYYAALLESANEVSSGIAEHVGGSIEGFTAMMNAKAAELGGTDSHFVNANGLPDDDHYTSAWDMALIGRAFYQNETLLEISGTAFYHIDSTPEQKDDIDLRNHHRMLPGCQLGTSKIYEYAIGGKTGYTDAARQTLVTFARKDGHSLVCVILKDEKPYHYLDSAELFNYGFACYDDLSVRAQIDAKAEELKPEEEEEEETDTEQPEELTLEEIKKQLGGTADQDEAAPDGTAAQGEDESDSRGKDKSGGISVLTIIVIAVVLAAVSVCGYIIYQSYRREKERKRRQAEIMARHRARKQAMKDQADW